MGQKFKIYKMHCGKCQAYILSYQKYGSGKGILRLYMDRIIAPDALLEVIRQDYKKINEVPNLQCPSCEEVLGTSAISKGQKWVYRMRQGYFHRRLVK